MNLFAESKDALTLSISLGSLGGVLLICMGAFLGSGPSILLGFAAIGVAGTAVIRAEQVESFTKRFWIAMGAFALSTLMLYVVVAASPQTALLSIGGHSWRILFVLAASAAAALPVARLSRSSAL